MDQQSMAPFEKVCEFVIKLGEAAHKYGSSTARLETFLSSLMTSFGYIGTVLSSPNEMIFALQETKDKPQRFHMLSSLDNGLDLDKLARLGDLVNDVVNGQSSIDVAYGRLKEISKTSVPWGTLASAISYAATGAGIAGVLMGSWTDIAVSVPLSLIVYGIVVLSARFGSRGADWLPLLSALIAGFLAALVKSVVPELNIVLVVLSAVAVLLPGYTISQGLMEVLGGHVFSGNINMLNGLIYLAKQFVGGWIGVIVVNAIIPLHSTAAVAPDILWQWLFVPGLIIGLCLAFQTSRRDFIWACLSCTIAYIGMLAGTKLGGANFGNLLGTVIAVVFSNTWASRTGRPTSIVLVPAIILMVSGTIGFRGLASLASGNVMLGEQQITHMFVVALTVGVGLLLGNTISRSKVTL